MNKFDTLLFRFFKFCALGSTVSSIIFLLGCANNLRNPNTLDAIEQSLKASQPEETITTDTIDDALLPPIDINVPGATGIDTEPRFDLKVNRVAARTFFMGLVQGTPYNMVVHPKVKGSITLDLKSLTVTEVLNTVRDVYGYDYEKTVSGFQVYPNTMRTRIFKINYLDVVRDGSSQMRVSSGQVTESNTGSESSGTSGSSSSSSSSATSTSGAKVSTTSSSNFWLQLEKSVKSIVGKKDGRNVVVNKHSGVIVVHALPGELRAVSKFVETTQNIIQRQVIIEAKIIEVELSDGFQSGINWSALGRSPGGNSSLLLSQTGGGSVIGSSTATSIINGNTGNLAPNAFSGVDGSETSAFGGVFSLALQIGNSFTSFLELLETQGDVHVLSSPQVSTINNQKAVIKVGQDEFFITDVDSNTNTSSSTSTTQNNVELTPFFSGVALDVIPQIGDNGSITLHIHPTVSTVIEKVKQISLNSASSLSVPLALSSIRESDTIIRAQDGQVVIIGGLMQNSTSNEDAGVPVLGDIPLIGGLFKHKRKSYKKSELVILLRPVIVKDDTQWSAKLQQIQTRIGNLYSAPK